MNKEKLDVVLELFLQERTRKEIMLGVDITADQLDTAIREGLRLYGEQLENNEPEFNEKTKTFSEKGFENNVDFLCARIESDPEFSEDEIAELAEQGIETNYDLIYANHDLQKKLAGHFTVPIFFPIIFLPDQEEIIKEKLKKH